MTNEDKLQLLSQEEFAQSEPLTTRLRGLVRSYPKGVGLVQEFVQNADDAGAQEVHVFLDERTHSSSKLPSPSMSELQGPAFVVVNDATFSEQDWQNIQKIGQSGKALETTKTGRFGLGFNSVYNVTDFPMLLTGPRIGIFDPHAQTVYGASRDKAGNAWRLNSALWSHFTDLLSPFELFGLATNATEFNGTIFRLPIRTETRAAKSAICQQPFSQTDFYAIVDKLHDTLPDLLIFLRAVHKLDISVVDDAGQSKCLLSARTINRAQVDLARQSIREALSTPYDTLLSLLSGASSKAIVSEYDHEIEIRAQDGEITRTTYRVVIGLFGDSNGDIAACSRKMQDLKEKAVPLAGAAARVGNKHNQSFRARLFCTLPLPSPSPLEFCHVNGFFDLQADRQGLFQDLGSEGTSAVRVNWNRLLLKHCCSEAAARLCHTLAQDALATGSEVYEHWPRVPEKEQTMADSLIRHVYERLSLRSCMPAGGSSAWKRPYEVLIPGNRLSDKLRSALLSDTFLIPNPPMPGFVATGFKAAGISLSFLDPAVLRQALRVVTPAEWELSKAPRPCLRDKDWICAILEYCTSDGELDDLVAVPLALTADGTLRVFGKSSRGNVFLGSEEERSILFKRPDWFLDTSCESALESKESARAKIYKMTPQRVLVNLHLVLPSIEADGKASYTDDGAPSEDWLTELFEYLGRHVEQISINGDLIRKLPIVPDQHGYLHAMGSANTPLLPGSDHPKPFLAALTHLGVPLVNGSEKLMKAVRRFCERFPKVAIWPLTPLDLIDTLHAVWRKGTSDSSVPSLKHATAILDFISSHRSVKDLKVNSDRLPKLRSLRLFPTTTAEIVSLDVEQRFIPAAYNLPRFAADVGLLATGKDNSWLPLYQALGVPKLTRARLITAIILPRLNDLAGLDCYKLLAWLRANLQLIREEEESNTAAALIAQLKDVLPVACTDGSTRPPRLLYHPDSDFAAPLLGNRIGFPDLAVYHDRPSLWLEFFETLGMERVLRADDIVSAIDDVIASKVPDGDKVDRLSKIAEYVDSNWEVLRNEMISAGGTAPNAISFCEALKQRTWLPALTKPPRDYPAKLLSSWERQLFRPAELLPRATLPLVSSIRPICQTNRISHMQSDIGFPSEADLEDVLAQLANLSNLVVSDQKDLSERVADVFADIYTFLGKYFEDVPRNELDHDSHVCELRKRSAQIPCLIDSTFKLWQPHLCFSESVTSFLGLRARVRAESEAADRGLFILGRRERPEISDYIAFFHDLFLLHASAPISENDRGILRSAYLNAALSADSTECRGCPILLETGVLSDDKAVFDNAPWLSERARRAGLVFVDPRLSEAVIKAFGVSLLSSAVYEKSLDEPPSLNSEFATACSELEDQLRSPLFHKGICRLARAAGGTAQLNTISTFFERIKVIAASTLTTVLVWADSGIQIDGSTGECDVVFDPERKALVVSEETADVLFERVGSVLSNELRYDGHDLREFAAYLVAIMKVPPEDIERRLTKLRVPQLFEDSAETPPETADDTSADYLHESLGWQDELEAALEDATISKEAGDSPQQVEAETVGNTIDSTLNRQTAPQVRMRQEETKQGPGQQCATSTPENDSLSHAVHEQSMAAASGSSQGSNGPGGTYSPEQSPIGDRSKTGAQVHRKSRSEGTNRHRGRARTYVAHSGEGQLNDTDQLNEHRSRVETAAVRKVMELETKEGRIPKEMPHSNEGYDIESYAADGTIERYIEVKGLSGPWSEFGVSVSREQFRKASKEGDCFYLYVVEFALEADRARAYSIQDPANRVDEFWYDSGWIDLARAYGNADPVDALVKGGVVVVDGIRRAIVTGIHRRGALILLELDFDDGSQDKVVYSQRRIQVVEVAGTESEA